MKSARLSVTKVLVGAMVTGAVSALGAGAASAAVTAVVPSAITAPGPDIALGSQDSGMVVAPNGSTAYMAGGSAGINVFDLASGALTAQIALPGRAFSLQISRDGTEVYASVENQAGGDDLFIVSTATNTVAKSLRINSAAFSIEESANGQSILALGTSAEKPLFVIDRASGALTQTLPLAALDGRLEIMDLRINPGDGLAYLNRSATLSPGTTASDVLVVDIAAGQAVRTLEPCNVVFDVDFSVDGATTFVSCSDGQVVTLDTATGAVVGTVNAGFALKYAQLTANGSRLVVAGEMHSNVGEIDTATGQLVSVYTVAGSVSEFSAPSAGNQVWYIRGNVDGSQALTSLVLGPDVAAPPVPAPNPAPIAVIPPEAAPVPPAEVGTIAAAPQQNSAAPAVAAASPSTPDLAATGAGSVISTTGGAALALLLVVGGIALRFRSRATVS